MIKRYEIERDGYKCHITGHFVYHDEMVGRKSGELFLKDFVEGKLDFNLLLGSYRVIIKKEATQEEIFFGDNSGGQCFYFDEHDYGENFIDFVSKRGSIDPNYISVVQLLMFDRIYNGQTLVQGVRYTDVHHFYVKREGKIYEESKNLHDFDSLHRYKSLHEIIIALTNFEEDENIFAVATGGTDSRLIVSHLYALGIPMTLCVSGEEGHADIKVARDIAKALGLPLLHSELSKNKIEMEEAFKIGDGQAGLDNFFRLGGFSKLLQEQGADVVFGGHSGEHYKNYFINQDAPAYTGEGNMSKLYRMKIGSSDFPLWMCGEKTEIPARDMEKIFFDSIGEIPGKNKFQKYTQVGEKKMKAGVHSHAGLSQLKTLVNPLTERDAIALVYNEDPKKLDHHQFHRREISKYAPKLKGIKTNLGVTCTDSRMSMWRDEMVRIYRGVGRRFFKVNDLSQVHEKPMDFRRTEEYAKGVKTLKSMGILSNMDRDVPNVYADRILTMSLLFEKEGK